MWRYLKGSSESFAEGTEDGAALIQFKFTWILTKILSHRLGDVIQSLEGGLRFGDSGLGMLRTNARNTANLNLLPNLDYNLS